MCKVGQLFYVAHAIEKNKQNNFAEIESYERDILDCKGKNNSDIIKGLLPVENCIDKPNYCLGDFNLISLWGILLNNCFPVLIQFSTITPSTVERYLWVLFYSNMNLNATVETREDDYICSLL